MTRAGVACLLLPICLLAAYAARSHGSFHQRLEAANARAEAEPGATGPLLARAELFRHHGDYQEALADVERAAERDPEFIRVEHVRARILLDAGRSADAIAAYGRFLAVEPRHPAAREGRARALLERGRNLEAARDLDVAIAEQPVPLPETYLARSGALAAAGPEQLPEAIRGLDAGLAVLGPVVTLERAAVELELQRGEVDAALERLDRIRVRSPRQESWLAQRGEILEGAGRPGEARGAYLEALTALEQLPPHRRSTAAMSELEAKLRRSVQRTSPSAP